MIDDFRFQIWGLRMPWAAKENQSDDKSSHSKVVAHDPSSFCHHPSSFSRHSATLPSVPRLAGIPAFAGMTPARE